MGGSLRGRPGIGLKLAATLEDWTIIPRKTSGDTAAAAGYGGHDIN